MNRYLVMRDGNGAWEVRDMATQRCTGLFSSRREAQEAARALNDAETLA